MNVVAIIPVKEFKKSKTRLSKLFTANLRVKLVKEMLKNVLFALIPSVEIKNIIVVTPNKQIAFIRDLDRRIRILHDNGAGQIPALEKAISYALKLFKPDAILIAVADMPLIRPWDVYIMLEMAREHQTVVLAPSYDGGTNVMIQNPPQIIGLKYGPKSFLKHLEEAYHRKIKVRMYFSETSSIDLDAPEDVYYLMKNRFK